MSKITWLSDVRQAKRILLQSAAGTDQLTVRVRELELALLAVMEALEESQARIDQQSSVLTSLSRVCAELGRSELERQPGSSPSSSAE